MTSRHTAGRAHRHETALAGDDRSGEFLSAMPDAASDHALREAEEHLSGHWNHPRSLYPSLPEDTAPH
ncbi:hypothetical protein GCM10023084_72650 [Streptomyces lacrimifluminis]|uniref:Uncharacterized protein n=1 Tax=Streptomyces lacrimifluminis TaxID=1500077 RepID=A0A917UK78_9ACTN|nr:hypothetical protein GCM10012282_70730 [Streptomyces lacrimifluminis]